MNAHIEIMEMIKTESSRPYKLFRHVLGNSAASDDLLFHEEDEAYFLSVHKTKSKRFIVMRLASNTTTEVHVLDADDADGTLRAIQPRQHEREYYVAHHGEHFYILTNDDAKNFRLYS